MKKNPLYLHCILERIEKIEIYLKSKTKKDFLSWDMLQSGVAYNLQIIKRLSKKIGLKISDIPWHAIGDLDDNSKFGYMQTDQKLVWKITKIDLPKLKKRAEKILIN